ncbi:hypothetical protein TWF730_003618 [Orbilia blumenaviensis]|uniref:Uncharacterized protein n=1 Tax=Orbilia blumenaviensis TaxID=1796055 RepID=A0AAV9U473_9PEZI
MVRDAPKAPRPVMLDHSQYFPSAEQIEQSFQQQRAEFYLNSIPLAHRNGDIDAVETAYDRLSKLTEFQAKSTDDGTTTSSSDLASKLCFSRANKRQLLGKWQSALDALDSVNPDILQTNKYFAVSFWCLRALIYLGLEQTDNAEEAGKKALDTAGEVVGSNGEGSRNTSYFIMALIMARKEDRMEAAFYKSLIKEAHILDKEILENQWAALDAINGTFGVKIKPMRSPADMRGIGTRTRPIMPLPNATGRQENTDRVPGSTLHPVQLDQNFMNGVQEPRYGSSWFKLFKLVIIPVCFYLWVILATWDNRRLEALLFSIMI